ncbi:cytochrome c [Rhizobium sp.]|uniref:c-type cytochrome n=1 Tax=Rhizobium sp. TaxID=391 RepID=UPI0028A046B5
MRHSLALLVTTAMCAVLSPWSASAADQADQISRGQYQAILGDCAACHTKPGGQPLAGGAPLETPFGPLVPPNITPDLETGIGSWTAEEFKTMMRTGIGHGGKRLYPAMPYPAYTKMSDRDVSDLWQYLTTVQPVKNEVEANQLPFPFNIRFSLFGWNLLNFTEGTYQADPSRSDEWNRGAYLVTGAGHCSTCHTPKSIMGADQEGQFLKGSSLQGWYAPDITGGNHTGIGSWTSDEIVTYLKTGVGTKTIASGPMAEAIENSTSKMDDADLAAIATYLKSLPDESKATSTALPANDPRMIAGQAIYRDNCSACHSADGKGAMPLFPALSGNQIVQQGSPETPAHLVLFGSQGGQTDARPTKPSMPALAWRLSDKEVADVLTYVRNSWGNSASAVGESDVKETRESR